MRIKVYEATDARAIIVRDDGDQLLVDIYFPRVKVFKQAQFVNADYFRRTFCRESWVDTAT